MICFLCSSIENLSSLCFLS